MNGSWMSKLAAGVVVGLVAAPALAVTSTPVDLSGWIANTNDTGDGDGNWQVQNPANSVRQADNSSPSVFFDPNFQAQGQALSGQIRVGSSTDDDFIGFVLGYSDGEIDGDANFILVDWKKQDQTISGAEGLKGLAISHAFGDLGAGSVPAREATFWGDTGAITEIKRGANLGDTGWDNNVDYTFDLVFGAQLIEVSVNDVLELSITPDDVPGISAFDNGSFGFYNYSQENVFYSAIEQREEPRVQPRVFGVPAPAPLAMIAAGLLALGHRAYRG